LTNRNSTIARDYNNPSTYVLEGYQAAAGNVRSILTETTRYVNVAESQAMEKAVAQWEAAQSTEGSH
jgi:hypothetical protein